MHKCWLSSYHGEKGVLSVVRNYQVCKFSWVGSQPFGSAKNISYLGMCNNRILGFWNKCFLGPWPRIFGERSGNEMPESHWNCTAWATVKYWIVPLNTCGVENFICLRRQRSYLCFRNNLKPGEFQEPLRGFSLPFHWKTWIEASYACPVCL